MTATDRPRSPELPIPPDLDNGPDPFRPKTWSLRTRLSVAVAGITLLLGSLGAAGTGAVLENAVTDQAIADHADWANSDAFWEEIFDQDEEDDSPFPEEKLYWGLLEAEEETRFVVRRLASTGQLQTVLDEFGDGDRLGIFTAGAVFELEGAAVTTTYLPLELLEETSIEGLEPLSEFDLVPVSSGDLFDLAFASSFGEPEPNLVTATTELDGLKADEDITVGLIFDLSEELDSIGRLTAVLWTAAAIATVLAAAGTWLIARQALDPVHRMTQRLGEITDSDRSARVSVPAGRNELSNLAETMNSMLGRLESADTSRRQFVSDAAHELRTPVAVLRSQAEVAAQHPESIDTKSLATVVGSETNRLEGIVESLLTLARSDEDKPRRQATELDLDDIVLAETARARPAAIDTSGVSAGRVSGRKEELAQMVGHLLDNAARHCDSVVRVSLSTTRDQVVLRVEDDGTGIDESERQRVFERFVRLDGARDRDRGGAGLGLAVVASIVADHHGTVKAIGSSLGGAQLVVELPAYDPEKS